MVDEASEDEVIRERAFRISDKLDIGDIVDPSLFEEKMWRSMIIMRRMRPWETSLTHFPTRREKGKFKEMEL